MNALNRWRTFILLFFIYYLATDYSFAGAVLYRVQQMRAMKQRQSQQMTQEQYQAYLQEQQAQAPQSQPASNAQPSYQQTIDQRNQSIAQAIITAHHQPAAENEPFGNKAEISQPSPPQVSPQAGSSDVKEVVDLSEVWKKLDKKSTVWTLLIDDQAKILTVSEYHRPFPQAGGQDQ